MREVWILTKSYDGPQYDIEGVFATRDLALEHAGGSISDQAGWLFHGGWKNPDGTPAWREYNGGTLTTEDMNITRHEIQVRS